VHRGNLNGVCSTFARSAHTFWEYSVDKTVARYIGQLLLLNFFGFSNAFVGLSAGLSKTERHYEFSDRTEFPELGFPD